MKKYVEGQYVEMTEEEMDALKAEDDFHHKPTVIERLEAIEALLLEEVLTVD